MSSKVFLLFLLLGLLGCENAFAHDAPNESAYERIIRTGVLRCGYVEWPPYLLKDPNTGQFSGIAYDLMMAVGKELDLKIEWREAVGWGDFYAGLNAERFDMMCSPIWESGQRAKIALLSQPVYFNGLYAFAKADDKRFDTETTRLNNKAIRIAVVENDVTQAVRKMKFPQAGELALPPQGDSSQILMSVVTGKADAGLENLNSIEKFNAHSQEKLQLINGGRAVRVFASVYAVKRGEVDLKYMIDSTVQSLQFSGVTGQIIEQYKNAGILEYPE